MLSPLHNRCARMSANSEEKALQRSAFSGRDVTLSSVVQLQSKLNLPRIVGSVASGADRAEVVGVGEIGRSGDRHNTVSAKSWRIEVGVVENVKELSSELQ